jgi:hypothetical protein
MQSDRSGLLITMQTADSEKRRAFWITFQTAYHVLAGGIDMFDDLGGLHRGFL